MPRPQPPARPLPLQQAAAAQAGLQPDWPQAFALLGAMHERERSQAARVLHDRIAQSLSAIKLSAHLCLSEDDAAQVREDLHGIMAMADQAVLEVRALEQGLCPPPLASVGLHGALRVEALRHSRVGYAPALELQLEDLPHEPSPLPVNACLRILRLALEVLAPDPEAGAPRLHLAPGDADRFEARLQFDPADGWPGFDPSRLALMHALAVACGGSLHCSPSAGSRQGFALSLPYAHVASLHASAHEEGAPG